MISKAQIAQAMKLHGGSFVAGLGHALLHADAINAVRIQVMWPELLERYEQIAAADEAKALQEESK